MSPNLKTPQSAMRVYRPLPATIHLICRTCDRSGRYSLERYREITGDVDPHTALLRFAEAAGCERAKDPYPTCEQRCGIVYDIAKQGL